MGKILAVAEKPSAGQTIAKILGCTQTKDGYIEGDKYVVTWAVGHLVGLKDPNDYDEAYKSWKLEDLPFNFPINNALKVLPKTAKQYKVIKSLIHRPDIEMLINCGDAGREGLLIQEWIYRMCGNKLPKKILWADSLAQSTLKKAFANLKDYDEEFKNLLNEAEARAECDWDMGMNYSRALTLTKGGGKNLLVYGRCQTPLLNLISIRDKEIENFKPEPYYQVKVITENGITMYLTDFEEKKRVNFDKDNKDKAEAVVKKIKGQPCIVKDFKQTKKEQEAPFLLDLATLQKQMGAKYGFSADKTLAIAQVLYEKYKIISYPRTDSRFLTKDIFGEIKEHIEACHFGKFAPIVDHIKPENIVLNKYYNDRKVTDHHALIPNMGKTAEKAYDKLSPDEKKVFDAIVLSFLAIFYPPYKYLSTEIFFDVGGEDFYVKGNVPIKYGYKNILKDKEKKDEKDKEKDEVEELPEVKVGDSFNQGKGSPAIDEKITKAPPKYTVSSIIELMEKYHIGTPATRAEIIKKLIDKHYITLKKTIYEATPFGNNYIKLVPDHLKSPELTKKFEEKLAEIHSGKLKKDVFLDSVIEDIRKDITQFQKEKPADLPSIWEGKELGTCPICGKGKIKENKKTYGCSEWKNSGCSFAIWKTISGKNISEKMVIDLIEKKKTGLIKGFTSREGKKYNAYLTLNDEGKVVMEYENGGSGGGEKKERKVIGKCPICGGDVVENTKAFGCSNWKDGCKFTVWKTMSKKNISEKMVKDIIEKGKTGVIKGFKNKDGDDFDAKLIMEEDGSVKFEYV